MRQMGSYIIFRLVSGKRKLFGRPFFPLLVRSHILF